MALLANSLILVILAVSLTDAARILVVIPFPSYSHQVVFRPLNEALAKRGHEVVVITTNPAYPKGNGPENLTEINVGDVSYKVWRERLLTQVTGKKYDLYNVMDTMFSLLTVVFEKQIQTNEIQQLIRDKNVTFDLVIGEACVQTSLIFSYLYKAPAILISTVGHIPGTQDMIGAPSHPLLYPLYYQQRLYNLTFWEKLVHLYKYFLVNNLFYSYDKADDDMLRRNFGNDAPTVSELKNNVHMLFLNTHMVWEDNLPLTPSVLHIGGLHEKPVKELPAKLKSQMDSSKNGIIYVSFGSNINPADLPPEKIQIFLKVFSQLPYDVFWKWNEENVPEHSENVKFSKWFPQSDVLRHPKVKLFIMQGGLISTDEAILAGVPLIGVPMMTDQWYNVEKYLKHKIGLKLDLDSLTEGELRSSILTVIEDKNYKSNIENLRSLMYDQPLPPLERAVWWTEHVLRHSGTKHLRAPAANISWREFLMLDVLIPTFLILITLISITLFITNRFIKWFLRNFKFNIKIKKL